MMSLQRSARQEQPAQDDTSQSPFSHSCTSQNKPISKGGSALKTC
jgi:hypothetical protein